MAAGVGVAGEFEARVEEDRKILVAVDESEQSIHALKWYLCNLLSKTLRTSLILLYVKSPLPAYSSFDGLGYILSDEVISSMEKYNQSIATSILEKSRNICKEFQHDKLEVQEKLMVGDARDVICDMVEKLGVDLLVMGSHGYGFIQRTFLGSVSDYCVRNAKCPVMIVKRQ